MNTWINKALRNDECFLGLCKNKNSVRISSERLFMHTRILTRRVVRTHAVVRSVHSVGPVTWCHLLLTSSKKSFPSPAAVHDTIATLDSFGIPFVVWSVTTATAESPLTAPCARDVRAESKLALFTIISYRRVQACSLMVSWASSAMLLARVVSVFRASKSTVSRWPASVWYECHRPFQHSCSVPSSEWLVFILSSFS